MKGKIREIRSIWNTMNVSLRSRRLEVVGTRKNGRARRRHAREERKRTTVQADSQGHVSHYHELMSRVWPVNAYFLL